jgi:hypothetical protein
MQTTRALPDEEQPHSLESPAIKYISLVEFTAERREGCKEAESLVAEEDARAKDKD